MPDEKDTALEQPTVGEATTQFGVPPRPLPTAPAHRKTGQHPRIIIEGEDGTRLLTEWSQQRTDTLRILTTLNDTVIPWVRKVDTDQTNDRAINAREFDVIHNNITDMRAGGIVLAARVSDLEARPMPAPIAAGASAQRHQPIARRIAFVVAVTLVSIGSLSGIALGARYILER